MISRIRIDLFGRTAAEIEQRAASFYNSLVLKPAETETRTGTGTLQVTFSGTDTYGPHFQHVGKGELVIERDLNEPEDSQWAYKGRALFYPDISTATDGAAHPPTFLKEEAA